MIEKMPLPISFRYLLIEDLLRTIEVGESATVIGIASVGKSNVVHALQQSNIQTVHLDKQTQRYLIVWIDGNDLMEVTPWHLFELLLYRLSVHCEKANLPTYVTAHLQALHEKLLEHEHDTFAQRHFQAAIRWLCQTHHLKVVMLFDEFDLLFQELPGRLFAILRSVRDKNKYSLVYLLFLRQALDVLRPDSADVEAFVELFQARTYYLKPYDLAGVELMLDRLSERRRLAWPGEYTPTLFDLSGGHSGLVKIIYSKILPCLENGRQVEFDFLFDDAEVAEECHKIWDSLTGDEHVLLQRIVNRGFPREIPKKSAATVAKLMQKGVIQPDQDQPRLFSTLFNRFVKQTGPEQAGWKRFEFDHKTQTCRINNREIYLPALPARLLELLYNNRGKPCKRIDILQYLYPDEDHSQLQRLSDDPRLYDVVKNLRKKIEPDPQKPRYIKTVRGLGFKLDI